MSKGEPFEESELYEKVSTPPLNNLPQYPRFNIFREYLEELEKQGFLKHKDLTFYEGDVDAEITITIWWRNFEDLL